MSFYRKLELGQDVDSFCTRCNMLLAHTILSMGAGRVERVRCNTCKSEHKHRGAQPAGTSTPARRRDPDEAHPKPKAKATVSQYQRLMQGRDVTTAVPYSPMAALTVPDLVLHSKFGVGVVSALKAAGKVEVVFDDAVRVLVCSK